MTNAAGLVALLAAIVGCYLFTLPYLRERARLKREKQANCSHSFEYRNAMNDPTFPFRQCKTCGYQEQLTRCLQCGKTLTRRQGGGVGKPIEEDERGGDDG